MKRSSGPILSFVLAIKDPIEAQFDACVCSMAALKNSSRFDLIVVSAGTTPKINPTVKKRLHKVTVIRQRPEGVYSAYNKGLDYVKTDYVMVIGCDDLLLPGLDDVIDAIPQDRKPHLIAACSLMQNVGISRPSRFRWGLVFRNWCQQGLLYRSDVFKHKRFDPKYKIQSDHKFNMELVSDARTEILRRPEIVVHFSHQGLSSSIDWAFMKDMPSIVRSCYGNFFWMAALMKRTLGNLVKGRSMPNMKSSA